MVSEAELALLSALEAMSLRYEALRRAVDGLLVAGSVEETQAALIELELMR